jgi:transposase-like protein
VSYYRGLSVIAAGLDGVALSLIGAPGRCYDSREGGETLASQPKRAAFAAEIEAAGGDGVILDRLRSGETVKAIADTYGVSRGMIYLWKKMGGESRADAWEEARKDSAEALLEDAGEILDDLAVPGENGEAPDPSNAQVSVARERAGHRRYLAEKFNREALPPPGGVAIEGYARSIAGAGGRGRSRGRLYDRGRDGPDHCGASRLVKCDRCGADVGNYQRPGENGPPWCPWCDGVKHALGSAAAKRRDEAVEAEHGEG